MENLRQKALPIKAVLGDMRDAFKHAMPEAYRANAIYFTHDQDHVTALADDANTEIDKERTSAYVIRRSISAENSAIAVAQF